MKTLVSYVDGQRLAPRFSQAPDVINPATEEVSRASRSATLPMSTRREGGA